MNRGQIFTDMHIREADIHLLPCIYMPIALGGLDFPKEELQKIGMIYERMDRAEPRSINGYPIFLSFKLVSREDADYIVTKAEEFKAAEDKLMGVTDGSN